MFLVGCKTHFENRHSEIQFSPHNIWSSQKLIFSTYIDIAIIAILISDININIGQNFHISASLVSTFISKPCTSSTITSAWWNMIHRAYQVLSMDSRYIKIHTNSVCMSVCVCFILHCHTFFTVSSMLLPPCQGLEFFLMQLRLAILCHFLSSNFLWNVLASSKTVS